VRGTPVVVAATVLVIGGVTRALASEPTSVPVPEPWSTPGPLGAELDHDADAGGEAGVEAYAAPDAAAPATPATRGVVATFAVGAAYEHAIDVPLYGFDAVGTFGGRVASFEATGFYGRTQYGMVVGHLTGGVAFDGRVGESVRIGASAYLGYLEIGRHTRHDPFAGGELGASLHLDVDVASFQTTSLFLQLRGFGEIGGLPILGGALHFGVRSGP
jgi:hypothetical protein